MKLTVKTVRPNMPIPLVNSFMDQYQSDPKAKARINIDDLLKTGRSHTVIVDQGVKLETIITIEKD